MKNVLCAAALIVAAQPAVAEDQYQNYTKGIYVGLGLAKIKGKESDMSWSSSNANLLVGYELNGYIALEGETSVVISKGSVQISDHSVDIGNTHMGAYVKFALPTKGFFNPHVRLGYVKGKANASFSGISLSVDDTAVAYGIGAEYNFGKYSIRADYTSADFGASDMNMLSIMTVFRFN